MKTTIDISKTALEEVMRFTGAKTKREAVVTAVEHFNRLKRLEKLNARVRGKFRGFMTQAELIAMRTAETAKTKTQRN
jgi:Arc/MetJ family transcription regulator